jgi:hypothetical protein
MESINDIVYLIALPELAIQNNKSMESLLKDVSIDLLDIKEDDISNLISKNKEDLIIENWLNYSENKRTSEGWYFIKKEIKYEVGYFLGNGKKNECLTFDNGRNSCAAFIKRELTSITNLIQ